MKQQEKYQAEILLHATKLREFLTLRETMLTSSGGFPADVPSYVDGDEELDKAVARFAECLRLN